MAIVKSVEYIEVSVGSTDTIKSVNLSKGQDYRNCVPFMTSHSDGDYFDSKLFDIYFSGTYLAGVINFYRYNQRSNVATIKCYVVEFDSTEVRVQQGEFNTDSNTTHTITLPTSLNNMNKAAMVFAWKASDTTLLYNTMLVRGRVVSNTSIDFYRTNTLAECNGHWFLFEDLNTNFKVTHGSGSFSTISTDFTIDGGRCVDLLRSFLISSYATDTVSSYAATGTLSCVLNSNGNVYFERTTANNSIYWSCQVVEFLDTTKIYTPFEHYINTFSTVTLSRSIGGDATRVPFVCNTFSTSIIHALPQGISRSTNTTSASNKELFVSTKLGGSGTIDYTKSVASYSITPSYTLAVDWNGISVDTGVNSSPISEGSGPNQSFVKSVENFRFTLEDFFGAKVLTKGQNWQNCAVFASNRSTSGGNLSDHILNVYLVAPGIVCFKRWKDTGQALIDVSVVEFWPEQVKVQHKNIYTQKTNTTLVSIESVSNINKCFILSKSFNTVATNVGTYILNRVKINDVSTVEIYINANTYVSDTSFFVIEDLKNNFETIHFSDSFSGASQRLFDDTLRWETGSMIPIVSYASADVGGFGSRLTMKVNYGYEFNPFNFSKTDGTYYTIYWASTVIKFLDNKIHVQLLERNFGTTAVFTDTYNSSFSNEITCFNIIQQSLIQHPSATAAGTLDIFGTIRITDYVNKIYEQSKTGITYSSYGSFVLIDWIGETITLNDNKLIPTKSLVNSIQKVDTFEVTGAITDIFLNKGQDIKQCVPFITNSVHSSDSLYTRLFKSIYRYEDPDYFRIRSTVPETGNVYNTYYIVEFNKDIKIQYGEGYSLTTTKSFVIDQVNLDRTFLLFYTMSDATIVGLQGISICGHFNSSTEIEFIRTLANGAMFISWYTIECPDNDTYWKVQHLYSTSKGGAATVYADMDYAVDTYRSMFIGSWNTTDASAYASRSLYKMMHTLDNRISFTKTDPTYYNMNNLNVEVIEFSKHLHSMGLATLFGEISLNTTTTSGNVNLKQSVDVSRSLVISGNNCGNGSCSATSTVGHREGFHYYKFNDNSTVAAIKTGGIAYITSSFFYVYQFPEYNKYYIEGNVEDPSGPVIRRLAAYRTSTGELVDTTTSISGTGYYLIESLYPDEHYVVCYDDVGGYDYNYLVHSKILPAVISGTFAYNEGLVTTSGLDVGVPLCYL